MRLLLSRNFAALSKPRCGSTSLRRAVGPHMDRSKGDFAVDEGGERPPFHPHITAPYLLDLVAPARPDLIVTMRHPVDLLWSYYSFFQPDAQGRYNFHPRWTGPGGPDFETSVLTGRVGMNPEWRKRAPGGITPSDLSPLSLEAQACGPDGRLLAHAFPVERPAALERWLSARLETEVTLGRWNPSGAGSAAPALGGKAMRRLRRMFAIEAGYYGL